MKYGISLWLFFRYGLYNADAICRSREKLWIEDLEASVVALPIIHPTEDPALEIRAIS